MNEHTPGEWRVCQDQRFHGELCIDAVIDGKVWSIALVHGDDGSMLANALVMAAGPALLAACKAQHEAIDRLFAMLIEVTGDRQPFYPSESGQPWEAVLIGNAAILKATQP